MIQSGYYIEGKDLIITKGVSGYIVDKEAFTHTLYSYINNLNDKSNSISIPVKYIEPEKIDIEKIHSEVYKEAKNAYFEENPFTKENINFKGKKNQRMNKKYDFNLNELENFIEANKKRNEKIISNNTITNSNHQRNYE